MALKVDACIEGRVATPAYHAADNRNMAGIEGFRVPGTCLAFQRVQRLPGGITAGRHTQFQLSLGRTEQITVESNNAKASARTALGICRSGLCADTSALIVLLVTITSVPHRHPVNK